MTATYEAIATTTLTGTVSSVTFNSISGSYTDIVAVWSARSARSANLDSMYIRVNSDTANNYSMTQIQGNGSAASSGRETSVSYIYGGNIPAASTSSNIQGNAITHFMNYSNTTTNKTILTRANSDFASGGTTDAIVGLWRSTSAITSITFLSFFGNNLTGSFTLYGIKAE